MRPLRHRLCLAAGGAASGVHFPPDKLPDPRRTK
jgi:hypothetical protein